MLWQVSAYRNSEFTSVAWAPDGLHVAGAGRDGCIWLFDALSGERLALLEGHGLSVTSVVFSPDGKALASASEDRTIRLWDAATSQEIQAFVGHLGGVNSVAFSPDGKVLASGSSDETVRLWETASGQEIRACLGHSNRVNSVAFSPDGNLLVSGSHDQSVRLWETASGQGIRAFVGHQRLVLSVAFSPDAKLVASGSHDHTVRLWDADGGKQMGILVRHSNSVNCVAFTPDGRVLASASSDRTVRLSDSATGQEIEVCQLHTDNVTSVACNPDGTTLASGSCDNTIRLWRATNRHEIRTCFGHSRNTSVLAYSCDQRVIAAAFSDRTVRLLDAETNREICATEPHEAGVRSVAFSPDGSALASASDDGKVRLWNTASGVGIEPTLELEHRGGLGSVTFSPDGRTLAGGADDKTVRIWSLASRKGTRISSGHEKSVTSVAFSPDGKLLASGAGDTTVRLWEAAGGQNIAILRGHAAAVTHLHWTADSHFLISSDSAGATLCWRCSDWSITAQWPNSPFRSQCVEIVESLTAPNTPDWLSIRPLRLAPDAEKTTGNQIRFHCARVVLIGDGGAGKTCLAYRLQYNDFKEHNRTHCLQIWKLDAHTLFPGADIPSGERREVFLWDLGGQDAYRVIHQLFFPETKLAVFVFVPRGQRDLEILEDWSHCLEAQLDSQTKIPKLLVRSQIDNETQPDPPALEQLIHHCGFTQPFRISSKTGQGVDEFRHALYNKLDWTSVTELPIFDQVRDEVERAWSEGHVALDYDQLRGRFLSSPDFTSERFAEAVRLVKEEGLGIAIKLESNGHLVVNPAPLERYAGSIVLEAMRDKSAAVVEYRWVMTTGSFQGIEARLPREKELLILECAIQFLVERRVCLLVDRMLVFPQLFEDRGVAPPSSADAVRTEFAYDFTGAIQHVYATIAVTLALAGRFGIARYWADRAEYRLPSGEFFGVSVHRGDRKRFGKGEIEIYFSPDFLTEEPRPTVRVGTNAAVPQQRRHGLEALRQEFYATVVNKLVENKVGLKEKEKRTCETTGKIIPPEIFESWREQGITKGPCPMCAKHEILLWSPLISLQEHRGRLEELESATSIAASRSLVEVQARTNIAAEPANATRVLHLTDLHLRGNEDVVTLAQPLLTDLKKQGITTVDFLVVSGDFSDKCRPEGFQTALSFLRYLFSEHLIESPERFILVPGNHDQLSDSSFFVTSKTADPSFSHLNAFGEYYVRGPNYMDRFRHWLDMYKDLKKGDYPIEPREQVVTEVFADQKIQFLMLNSAWQTDGLQRSIGSLHPGAVARAIDQIKPECLTIAVWHHAQSEWEDESKTKRAYQLELDSIANLADAGVRLVLHGHVHERRSEIVNAYYSLNNRMHIMGGGAFGAKIEDRPYGTPRMYNLIEIASDQSRFNITTRSRAEANAPFEAHATWPVDGKPNDKTATLTVDLLDRVQPPKGISQQAR